jgi:Xaa-Pro aminopeptidase
MTQPSANPITPIEAFEARRQSLHQRLAGPALLCAGLPKSRNFRANHYRFRASSHFLYLVGRSMEGAALLLHDGKTTLFTHPPDPDDALWHGPRPSLEALQNELRLDEVCALSDIDEHLAKLSGQLATVPTEDPTSAAWLSERLGRAVVASTGDDLADVDARLADALVALRMIQDEAALAQLRHTGAVSAEAHVAGMRATHAGGREYDALGAMTAVLREHGLDDAYGPIVTTCGEVLHSTDSTGDTKAGDLMLADVGGETPEGWAADITRTWPVSGSFSSSQRAIYDVVLAAQYASIDVAKPGASYRDVHEAAKRTIVSGLCDLGIFRGDVDGLLERGAAGIFFPHGIGHLLGLDVHDMEDLGDRAGYAQGRSRSARFGDAFLRLDRDLEPGMLVTIEPGFYQVPGILGDEQYCGAVGGDLNRDELAKYSDVRGIRIEDDVLITADGNDILTDGVPKEAKAVEALVGSAP